MMNIKRIISLLLISAFMLSLTACAGEGTQSQAKSDSNLSFSDSDGNTITLKEKPKKVAVLFSSLADLWITAGGTVDISVGETTDRGFTDDSIILVDSGAGKTIDTEALLAAEPDFVICTADLAAQVETAQLMNKSGIPAAVFRVDNFEDYLNTLKIFTDITGNSDAYNQFGVDVQKEIDDILSKVKEQEGDKILFVRAGSSADSTKAKTAEDNFVCQMLKELKTYNIAENAPVLLDGLSVEEILKENPEYIFVSTMGKESAAKAYLNQVVSDPVWSQLDAVKNDKLIYLPKELFQYKPNKRWAEAYLYLAKILYPDLYL